MLPTRLPNWRLEYLTDGLALVPPQGAHLGAVRVRERLRPLRSAAHIFSEAAGRLPGPRHDGPIERMTTVEGEHAAVQVVRWTRADGVFIRCLGAVFGDDFYNLVDAGTAVPERFDFFERAGRVVTSYQSLGLGHRRVRRYLYAPPGDWQGLPRGLDTVWLAPGFPDDRTSFGVFAARPSGPGPAEVLADLLAGERLRGLSVDAAVAVAGEPAFTDGDLAGTRWRIPAQLDGAARELDAVVLEDDRFLYPLLGRFPAGADRSLFDRLVRSVKPVPLPDPRVGQDALLHWST